MTVSLFDDGSIGLEGVCPVDDAEPLLQLLLVRPDATIDWRGCESAHTAVVQVLMAARGRLVGPPRSDFLARFVGPALDRTHV